MAASKDCDAIAHTATQPAMTIAIKNPALDISSNVNGKFNVFETSRKLDIPVVSCSSIHVCGNGINDELVEGTTRFTRFPSAIDESYPTMTGFLSPL